MFENFKNEWLGRRVDFDGAYGYQCVDLVRQWWKEAEFSSNTGGVAGAIDYWRSTPGGVLAIANRVGSTQVQAGDVVILYGLSGNLYGHIGVATGEQDGSSFVLLEQNGQDGSGSGIGGNAIRTRSITKSRIAGLLRNKDTTPAPAPAASHTITLYPDYSTLWTCNANGSVGSAKATIRPPREGYTYDIIGQNGTYYLINSPTWGVGYINTDPRFVPVGHCVIK